MSDTARARSNPDDTRFVSWGVGAALIAVVTVAAYATSLSGAFVLDDHERIVNASRIRHLWPITSVIAGTERPLVSLTLAINYALGGLDPRGYHVVNLMFHVSAALVLYSILLHTFSCERLRDRFGASATGLATASAMIWAVHPLLTQAVTYVIQRGESLSGLCSLLALHAVVRANASRHSGLWYAWSIVACALGMATKPIAVAMPLAILAYDRVFLSRSWRELGTRRAWVYVGLAATAAIPAWLVRAVPNPTAGLGMPISASAYAATQPGVIIHYLRLSVWPSPLVFDYGWPIAQGAAVWAPSMIVAALIAITLWEWARRSPAAYPGVWFFLTLAPSSSIAPIKDLAAEHRMYLPLAGVVVLTVVAVDQALRGTSPISPPARGAHHRSPVSRRWFAVGLVVVVVAALGWTTSRRNRDYATEIRLWQDVVRKRPDNPRGYYALGAAYVMAGQNERAIPILLDALQRQPDNPASRENLGVAYLHAGRFEEALAQFDAVLQMDPRRVRGAFMRDVVARAYHNRGLTLSRLGRYSEAIASYREAIRLAPDDPGMRSDIGIAEAILAALDESLRDVPARLGADFVAAAGASDPERLSLEKTYRRVARGGPVGEIRLRIDLSGPEAHVQVETQGEIPKRALDELSRTVTEAMQRSGAVSIGR